MDIAGTASVGHERGLVPTMLEYDSADPYAVTFGFVQGETVTVWVIDRELLDHGMTSDFPVGDGDVSVCSTEEEVFLTLRSDTGTAVVTFNFEDIEEFMSETYAAVPIGLEGEHIDWAAELKGLTA
jgi:hypothetical protein